MRFFSIILILLTVSMLHAEEITNKGTVTTDEVVMEWEADSEFFTATLTGKATGWVSVGFNPTNKMKDANFIIGYVDGENVVIKDHFGHSPIGHKNDTAYKGGEGTENLEILGGSEENGYTTLKFRIPLNSGDIYDPPILKGVNKVIFAHSNKDNTKSKHKYVSSSTFTLE